MYQRSVRDSEKTSRLGISGANERKDLSTESNEVLISRNHYWLGLFIDEVLAQVNEEQLRLVRLGDTSCAVVAKVEAAVRGEKVRNKSRGACGGVVG